MGFGSFMKRAGGAIGGAASRVKAGGVAAGAKRTVKPAPAEQRYTTMPVKETKRMGGFKARLRGSILK